MPDKHVTLPITGMSCANCAVTIEKALNKKVPGVVKASVNFAAERAFRHGFSFTGILQGLL